jgi:hypothetical protein
MRLWKPPHTGLSHDADVSFCFFCLMSWCLSWRSWCAAALRQRNLEANLCDMGQPDLMESALRVPLRICRSKDCQMGLLTKAYSRRISGTNHLMLYSTFIHGVPVTRNVWSEIYAQPEPEILLHQTTDTLLNCSRKITWTSARLDSTPVSYAGGSDSNFFLWDLRNIPRLFVGLLSSPKQTLLQ